MLPVGYGAFQLDRVEREAAEHRWALNADHIADRLEGQLALRLSVLRQLASDPAHFSSESGFHNLARGFYQTFPDFQAINYINDRGTIAWVFPKAPNQAAEGVALFEVPVAGTRLREALETHRPTATGPIDLLQGGRGFATYFPISSGGAVNGVFRFEPLLSALTPPALAAQVRIDVVSDPKLAPPAESERRSIRVLGQTLLLDICPSTPSKPHPGALMLLALGTFVALVTGLLVHEVIAGRQRLEATEENRLALLESVPDHLLRLNRDLELVAYHPSPTSPPVVEHDRVDALLCPSLRDAIERARSARMVVATRSELRGRSYDVRVSPDGQGALLHLRDVTEQQALQAERTLLARLVGSSSQLAAVIDARGTIEYINPAGEALLGLQAGAPSDALAQRIDPFEPILSTRSGASWSGRVDLHTPDGTPLPCQATSFALDGPGTRIGLVAVDVSAMVRLERQLERAERMETIGKLAAGVAHDFNNALSVFRTGIQLLLEDEGMPEEAAEDLDLMRSAVESASHVAGQLLAFARPKARPDVIQVDGTLAATAKMLGRTMRENVRITWKLAAPGGCIVAPPGALEQVVLNLAMNARNAIAGSGNIVIASWMTRGGSAPRIKIQLCDDGCGIPKELQSKIFDPFFTTREAGHGLGLAMVRRVVEELGGVIHLESEPGVGTEVTLDFPGAWANTATLDLVMDEAEMDRRRILLADDEPRLRGLLRRALERAGHEVEEAADGLEAMEKIEHRPPDVVVTDIGMPRMSGAELAIWVQREHPEIAVLLMSGHPGSEPPDIGGRVEVVAKPVDANTLLARIAHTPRIERYESRPTLRGN